MNFHYTVETAKSFDEAVQAVESQTALAGYRVLYTHNVQETLKSKGLEMTALKIIEVCNAKHALALLQKELKMALFMPCRIIIYLQDGKTFISTMNTELIPKIVSSVDFSDLASTVNKDLHSIVDDSK